MVRGGLTGSLEKTLSAGGNGGKNLSPLSFSVRISNHPVWPNWGWVSVGHSPGFRGEAKTSEFHPGWFPAHTEDLGFRAKSTRPHGLTHSILLTYYVWKWGFHLRSLRCPGSLRCPRFLRFPSPSGLPPGALSVFSIHPLFLL